MPRNRVSSSFMAGRILVACLGGVLCATAAGAQGIGGEYPTYLRIDGPAGNGTYGYGTVGAGDVNGDGTADIVVSAPFDPGTGSGIYAYSGIDGSLIHQFPAPMDVEVITDLDCADFDLDGHDDILFGWATAEVPDGVKVVVWSGRTGEAIHSLSNPAPADFFGSTVAALGDVNLDGYPDFVVGAGETHLPGKPYAGKVYVYSGLDAKVIHEKSGSNEFDNFGKAVANAGDQDGDEIDDVLVGVPGFDGPGRNFGLACVFSGADFSQINCHYVVVPGSIVSLQQYGSSVGNAGDVDGDGIDNLIVGANRFSWVPNTDELGGAFVLDSNFEVLYQYFGEVVQSFLSSEGVQGAGDVNQDGFDDFLIWTHRTALYDDRGSVFLYSGVDGSVMARFDGEEAGARLFCRNRRPEDFDGDGVPEILLGQAPFITGGPDGSVHAIRFQKFLDLDSTELSATSGTPVIGEIDFPSHDGGLGYALLGSISGTGPVSIGGLEIPLTQDVLFQRMVDGNIPGIFRDPRGNLDSEGKATIRVASIPRLANVVGTEIHLAVVSHQGSNAVRVSKARSFTIVP